MTPPKGKKRVDEENEQGMSDEGVGNLFSGGGAPSGALAGWAATSAPAAAAVTPAPAPAPAPTTVIPQPARTSAPEPEPEPLDDADTAKPVGFYVSQNVAARFRKHRKQNDITHTQIVLLAVEAAAEKGIAQVVEDARRAPRFQSKLFAVTVKPDDSDLRGLGPVQLQYKPTRAQRAIIDQLVTESRLPDHTKFLAVVLDQYLPGRRDA